MNQPTAISAEQKMLEKATATYVAQLKSFLGDNVKATIQISGVPLSKLGLIAENLNDEYGDKVEIRSTTFLSKTIRYIYCSFKGEGWEVDDISV
jgi:hypothetical protein